ncbi:MAG: hypothetical protein RL701_2296 [Pseudomonadota bacterium]|jgi:hypothetical protein
MTRSFELRGAGFLIKRSAMRKVVWVGNIFSRASINSRDDGLEFGIVSGDGTITRGDIRHLAHMPWDSNGYLIWSGCNTGVMGMRRLVPRPKGLRALNEFARWDNRLGVVLDKLELIH